MAALGKTGLRPLVLASCAFGCAMTLATLAPNLAVELVALGFAGGASISFMSTGNSTLQLNAAPSMRGRVMSLWFVAFQGSTPIGGPVVGWVMEALGARAGLGLGAVTCFLAALGGAVAIRRLSGAGQALSARAPRPA
jgi:MFS family permease